MYIFIHILCVLVFFLLSCRLNESYANRDGDGNQINIYGILCACISHVLWGIDRQTRFKVNNSGMYLD